MKSTVSKLIFVAALVIGYIGFRFVTQAGQGLGVVQNDGYGGTGGVMILLAGMIIGYLAAKGEGKK